MTGMNTMAMTTRSIETRAQIQGNPAIQPNMHVLSSDDAGGVIDFILGGSKITADGDWSPEIKRRLLFGRKVMTNLDSILKSRDTTLQQRSI